MPAEHGAGRAVMYVVRYQNGWVAAGVSDNLADELAMHRRSRLRAPSEEAGIGVQMAYILLSSSGTSCGTSGSRSGSGGSASEGLDLARDVLPGLKEALTSAGYHLHTQAKGGRGR